MPAPNEEPTTVAIVEAHGVVREALVHLVVQQSKFNVTLACAPDAALGAVLRETPPAELVLVGVPHVDAPGMDALATLADRWPEARAIVYTASDDEAVVLRTHKARARGILRKGCTASLLMHGLRTVHLVGVFHDETTQRILLENPDGLTQEERRRERIRAQVTDKLMPVLERICRGDDPTYEVIAQELRLKPRTVERYANRLCELFGVNSKTALALSAVRLGIVPK